MFGGMKQKLQEMQQKMEETKARLDTITVEAKSSDELIYARANANRKITELKIDESKLSEASSNLNMEVMNVVNEALDKAEKVAESEMKGVAQGMIPGFPGL